MKLTIIILVLLLIKLVVEVYKRVRVNHPFITYKVVRLIPLEKLLKNTEKPISHQENDIYEEMKKELLKKYKVHPDYYNSNLFLCENIGVTEKLRQYKVSLAVLNNKVTLKEIWFETENYFILKKMLVARWFKKIKSLPLKSQNKSI